MQEKSKVVKSRNALISYTYWFLFSVKWRQFSILRTNDTVVGSVERECKEQEQAQPRTILSLALNFSTDYPFE